MMWAWIAHYLQSGSSKEIRWERGGACANDKHKDFIIVKQRVLALLDFKIRNYAPIIKCFLRKNFYRKTIVVVNAGWKRVSAIDCMSSHFADFYIVSRP